MPWSNTQTHFEHSTSSRLCNHAVDSLERDYSAFLSCDCCFNSCTLSFACVRVVAAIVILCFFLLPPYSGFDWNHLYKTWETPICGDSSQLGIDIRKITVVLKFDLWIIWEGLTVTLDRRRLPQRGVGFGRTTEKNRCVPCPLYFTVIFVFL